MTTAAPAKLAFFQPRLDILASIVDIAGKPIINQPYFINKTADGKRASIDTTKMKDVLVATSYMKSPVRDPMFIKHMDPGVVIAAMGESPRNKRIVDALTAYEVEYDALSKSKNNFSMLKSEYGQKNQIPSYYFCIYLAYLYRNALFSTPCTSSDINIQLKGWSPTIQNSVTILMSKYATLPCAKNTMPAIQGGARLRRKTLRHKRSAGTKKGSRRVRR